MVPHQHTGKLITFCGLDGCGKSTMIKMMSEHLGETANVFITKQPTEAMRKSHIFKKIQNAPVYDEYDYRSLALLASGDRVQHSNRIIVPALKEGKTVLSDRYFYSCLANLYARGYEDDTWIYEVSSFIPKPDIALFLDVDVETAIKRIRSRKFEKDRYINVKLQYKLRAQYLKIAQENNCVVIPSGDKPEKTFNMIKEVLENIIFINQKKDLSYV